MGKEIRIVCDCCGADVAGKKYVTLKPRRVVHGKQYLHNTIWLCPECFKKTKLQALLFGLDGEDV